MDELLALSVALADVTDRLALGVEMFGSHAVWIWLLPPIWLIAACLIWASMERKREALDDIYVAKAERNLPRLNELFKQRSTEILEVRAVDRDQK